MTGIKKLSETAIERILIEQLAEKSTSAEITALLKLILCGNKAILKGPFFIGDILELGSERLAENIFHKSSKTSKNIGHTVGFVSYCTIAACTSIGIATAAGVAISSAVVVPGIVAGAALYGLNILISKAV